ncbi:nicotinate-nucleotide--dimethylbenzimidazole phosphoribosyltransferase [Prauserella cavernicola]|uniref:Nicotinate-nucleotide--dimethylbenzimidazole phosphoribosyltransferase n=1 Tax=Prauserella cavernicola TaxID=2800127 RepID=A0A934QTG0_9PSEU|nr:nicotinate-nucleotide--dimethylbenzimidazole phosphoribosyltransferase [Prauserella cavernicola]MBK1786200.1 nicotinate-nucleotide--dimethylbenzimidazole phosphoribosyltransferase [Prauserella cavernicola]
MPIEFADVPHPDEIARGDALRRHGLLLKPEGSLGKLEDLGAWIAACQGQSPPRPLKRMRVVVFAGDHGIAAKGVSAFQPAMTGQMLAALHDGGTALNVVADVAGAGLRVVDVAVDSDDEDEFKIRRGSGSIDSEDALTAEQAEAAVRVGMRVADAEVDAGADLLVPADLGVGVTTPSSTLVAALTGTEPVAVIGRGSGVDDNGWMRKCVVVRDALRRARPVLSDPVELLRAVGGADLAAMAGFLAQAAVRRTPVLIDGLPAAAAALVAEEFAPGARSWWLAAHRSTEPAQVLALDHLDLEPVLDLGIRLGTGAGASAALPLLSASVRLLSEMASFSQVSLPGPA